MTTKETPQAMLKDPVASWKQDLVAHERKQAEKLYQVGEFSPYTKEARPIKWDAFRDASYEWISSPGTFLKNIGTHVRNIDTDFRGGRDYGNAGERLERVKAYAGIIALFTAFDAATSMPLIGLKKTERKGEGLTADDHRYNANLLSFIKLVDVLNDKYATALGNMYVEEKTGKRGFIHEMSDKGADTIQTGFDKTNDLVNGATLEGYLRIISQIPVAGALFEQGVTRISGWQEKSSLHTATGKMIYMALGIYIKHMRRAVTEDGKSAKLISPDVIARFGL